MKRYGSRNRQAMDTSQDALTRRLEELEKGLGVWRCLAATGFLTALGAFGLAVFGLSQLENTYFVGEVLAAGPPAATIPANPPAPPGPLRTTDGDDLSGLLALAEPGEEGQGADGDGRAASVPLREVRRTEVRELAATEGGS